MVDWRVILKKYLGVIITEEGTYFLQACKDPWHKFTPEELAALEELTIEVTNE